jgi:hypothetical protein
MTTPSLLLILAGLLTLPSCASPPEQSTSQPLPAEVLLKQAQCGATNPSPKAIWIDSLQSLEGETGGFTLAETVTSQDSLAQLDFGTHSTLRAALNGVDFTQYGVLLISMGRQPTAGYGLDYEGGSAQLHGNTLEVRVSWQEPEPAYLTAQVLTSPCLLLKLPAVTFQKIRVLDQKGQIRVTTVR